MSRKVAPLARKAIAQCLTAQLQYCYTARASLIRTSVASPHLPAKHGMALEKANSLQSIFARIWKDFLQCGTLVGCFLEYTLGTPHPTPPYSTKLPQAWKGTQTQSYRYPLSKVTYKSPTLKSFVEFGWGGPPLGLRVPRLKKVQYERGREEEGSPPIFYYRKISSDPAERVQYMAMQTLQSLLF